MDADADATDTRTLYDRGREIRPHLDGPASTRAIDLEKAVRGLSAEDARAIVFFSEAEAELSDRNQERQAAWWGTC